jgi:hypothetical protein
MGTALHKEVVTDEQETSSGIYYIFLIAKNVEDKKKFSRCKWNILFN